MANRLRWGFRFWCMAFLSVAAALSWTLAAMSQEKAGDEGQLISMERAWNQAELQHDPAALEQILSDDFIITETDGTIRNKREHMAITKDKSYHYDVLVSDDFRVKVYGSFAVVTGGYHEKGAANGAHFDRHGRFTDTWIHLGATWRCVASHDSLPTNN